MILLFVNLSKNWGGGEKWFFTVGKALRERGHEVHWLVYPGGELAMKLEAEKLPFQAMKLRSGSLLNSFAMRKLEVWLRSISADAVLLNGSHELKAVGLAAWRVKIPKIVFRRGVSYPLKDNFLNRWFIAHIPTHFLANSDATLEAFAETFPYVKTIKHTAIYNGIEMEKWTEIEAKPLPGQLVMCARLSPEKGIDRALKAIHVLKKEGIHFHLNILGDGPESTKLKVLATTLNIPAHVTFHGFVQDIRPELAKAWLFLFTPTHGEGTSLALVEAMALGVPCVAFDTPSMAEVIVHGETGFLAKEGDIAALAGHIKQILLDEALRNQLGHQAKERALQHFSMQRLVGKLEDFLGYSLSKNSSLPSG